MHGMLAASIAGQCFDFSLCFCQESTPAREGVHLIIVVCAPLIVSRLFSNSDWSTVLDQFSFLPSR